MRESIPRFCILQEQTESLNELYRKILLFVAIGPGRAPWGIPVLQPEPGR